MFASFVFPDRSARTMSAVGARSSIGPFPVAASGDPVRFVRSWNCPLPGSKRVGNRIDTLGCDESVLPAFEYEENWVNPILDQKHALDREQFLPIMDDYYRLLGWDVETGWPTEKRLAELGLTDVYDPMVSGAKSARETRPAWPEPVAPRL